MLAQTRQDNNFNTLRLIFASCVLVYHLVALSTPTLGAWDQYLAIGAELGVQAFFVTSGYLVYLSWEREPRLKRYARKRFRRLYPAYFVVIIVTVIAAVALVDEVRTDLFSVLQYLGWNLIFLNFLAPELPGVFQSNPHTAINGALWTLKIEVMFYGALPVIALLLGKLGSLQHKLIFLGLIYCGAEVWRLGLIGYGEQSGDSVYAVLARQLPGQMSFFAAGIAGALSLDALKRHKNLWITISLSLLLLSLISEQLVVFRAAGLAGTVLWFALAAPVGPNAAKYGDFSYGLYIVHFPLIQIFVASAGGQPFPLLFLCGTIVGTCGAAVLLWHGVEKFFLQRSYMVPRLGEGRRS